MIRRIIMTQQAGYQPILDKALGEYCAKGFNLREDEHFLYLFFRGERIAVFSGMAATPESVQQVCSEHLESLSAS